jgi:hypothetical protein
VDTDFRHLKHFESDFLGGEFVLLSRQKMRAKHGNVVAMHWEDGLQEFLVQ